MIPRVFYLALEPFGFAFSRKTRPEPRRFVVSEQATVRLIVSADIEIYSSR